MKSLPNGVSVFNATPHSIRFWSDGWPEPVEVEPDKLINAHPIEEEAGVIKPANSSMVIRLVRTRFVGDAEGEEIALRAQAEGADVVVGSIIAAQAYPGLVVAMVPAEGYERVPPDQKRMRPDKFTVF